MKRTGLIVLAVIVAIAAIVGIGLVSSKNSLVALNEEVNKAYSNIDTNLKRRADLIPNLVNTVKGLGLHEQEIIDSVTSARAKLTGASTQDEKIEAGNEMESALSRLLVVVENYPDIKSDQAYLGLIDTLEGTENRLNVARIDYNDAVSNYNSKVNRFPSSIAAGIFGYKEKPYFEASESDKEVPEVNFE